MEKLRNKYIQAIKSADDESALETVRLAALGKKGEVSLKMRELGQMSPEERHSVCLLYTSPSPRDVRSSRMPSSA